MSKINVIFLIPKLEYGGAERQLYERLKGLDKTLFGITSVTYYDGGELRSEIERIDGIRIISLGKRGRCDILPFLIRRWSVEKAYSGNPIWTWNTTRIDPGTYSIQVWARKAGSTEDYEPNTSITYTINPPPLP